MTDPTHTTNPAARPPAAAAGRPLGRRLAAGFARMARRAAARFDRAIGLPEADRESGAATIEFVFVFPIFVVLFLSAFEASLLLTRQLMLERAVDVVMRDVRLSTGTEYRHDQLRTRICERATILPQCDQNLVVEMTIIDRSTYAMPPANSPCVDRTVTAQAFDVDDLVENGAASQLMLVRGCYVIDPVFPGAGLGLEIVRGTGGDMRIVAASAFVQEP